MAVVFSSGKVGEIYYEVCVEKEHTKAKVETPEGSRETVLLDYNQANKWIDSHIAHYYRVNRNEDE